MQNDTPNVATTTASNMESMLKAAFKNLPSS